MTRFDLLLEQNPSATFILMRGDIQSVIASITRWRGGSPRNDLEKFDVAFLPQGRGATDSEDGNDVNSIKMRNFLHCEGSAAKMNHHPTGW